MRVCLVALLEHYSSITGVNPPSRVNNKVAAETMGRALAAYKSIRDIRKVSRTCEYVSLLKKCAPNEYCSTCAISTTGVNPPSRVNNKEGVQTLRIYLAATPSIRDIRRMSRRC